MKIKTTMILKLKWNWSANYKTFCDIFWFVLLARPISVVHQSLSCVLLAVNWVMYRDQQKMMKQCRWSQTACVRDQLIGLGVIDHHSQWLQNCHTLIIWFDWWFSGLLLCRGTHFDYRLLILLQNLYSAQIQASSSQYDRIAIFARSKKHWRPILCQNDHIKSNEILFVTQKYKDQRKK